LDNLYIYINYWKSKFSWRIFTVNRRNYQIIMELSTI